MVPAVDNSYHESVPRRGVFTFEHQGFSATFALVTRFLCRRFLSGLLLLLPLATHAQAGQEQSARHNAFPFPPTYGLGLPFLNNNQQSVRSRGMGGVGMAVPDEEFINDFNPANLAYTPTLMADADLQYGVRPATAFRSGGLTAAPEATFFRSAKLRIPTVRVAYPVLPGVVTAMLAYQPKRSYRLDRSITETVRYPADTDGVVHPPGSFFQADTGVAALTQASAALGFTISRTLAAGLQADYVWGSFATTSLSRYFVTVPTNAQPADTAIAWVDQGKLRSWRLTGALAWRLSITELINLRAGLSATWSPPLRAPAAGPAFGQPEAPLSGQLPHYLAEGLTQPVRATTRIPLLLRGGLGLSNETTWRGGLDMTWQRWSAYRSFSGQANLPDLLQLGVGAEYTPGGGESPSYLQRITYRLGARYGRMPREDLPRPLTETWLTTGASFPIGSYLEPRHSRINLALAIGRASYPGASGEINLLKAPATAPKGALVWDVSLGFTFNTKFYGTMGRGNCPIKSCHVRKKHMHDGVEYTGQPWYKKQNPNIGEKLPERRPTEPAKSPKRREKF